MILLMASGVLGQRVDPGRQNGNLDFRRTGVVAVPLIRPNQFLLPLFGNSHLLPSAAATARLRFDFRVLPMKHARSTVERLNLPTGFCKLLKQ